MWIYNTMSRKKEELVPLHEGKLGIYACGPTVYNYIHIGNANIHIGNAYIHISNANIRIGLHGRTHRATRTHA